MLLGRLPRVPWDMWSGICERKGCLVRHQVILLVLNLFLHFCLIFFDLFLTFCESTLTGLQPFLQLTDKGPDFFFVLGIQVKKDECSRNFRNITVFQTLWELNSYGLSGSFQSRPGSAGLFFNLPCSKNTPIAGGGILVDASAVGRPIGKDAKDHVQAMSDLECFSKW